MSNDHTDDPPAAPANQPLRIIPPTVVPAAEDEVIGMLAEQVRFQDEPETRATAARLLEAGYTVHTVAARLDIRPSTVWSWSREPEVQSAIQAGKERRKAILGQKFEGAADVALEALIEVAGDAGVAPRDRVTAASQLLDRCGITPERPGTGEMRAVVAVDIDFDERLARIVAGSATQLPESG